MYYCKSKTSSMLPTACRLTKNRFWFVLLCLAAALSLPDKTLAAQNINIDATNWWSYSGSLTTGSTYNITLSNRTFISGVWEPICLPFNATKAVLDQAFGTDNYYLEAFDRFEGQTFFFKQMQQPAITAGACYFIRTKSTVSNPVFSNVTVAMDNYDNVAALGNSTLKLKGNYYSMGVPNDGKTYYKYVEGKRIKFQWDGGAGNLTLPAWSIVLSSTASGTTPLVSLEATPNDGTPDGSLTSKMAYRVQLTNAPTLYIDIPDVGDLDTDLTKNRTTGEAFYHNATITVRATSDPSSPHYCESFEETDLRDLEIKVRGNSTADPSKRPYRLKFAKKKGSSDGLAHKHDLLGRGYQKRNWVLLANAFDNSLIRNALTAELSEMIGMPFTPGYKFVDLVINGDYRGTYQVTDHPEADPDRIPVDEDTGWYVEFQGRGDMLDQPMCFSQDNLQVNIKNPEPADETDAASCNAVIDPIKDWLVNTWKPAFDRGTDPHGWRAYNDEDSWMKFLLITEITADWDGIMSVKAYRDTDTKLSLGPVWDKDLAYGNITCANDNDLTVDFENSSSIKTFVDQLYSDPLFISAMKHKLDSLIDAGMKKQLNENIDRLAETVAQTWAMNYSRWGVTPPDGSMEKFYSWQDQASYVKQLKEWLSTRIDRVQTLVNARYAAVSTPTAFTYDVTTSSSTALTNAADHLVNATMKGRTFVKDQWQALTLPFAASEAQLSAVFGTGYGLKQFTAVSADGREMLFTTPATRGVVAGEPYLIEPTTDVVSTPRFDGVVPIKPTYNWKAMNGYAATYGDYTFTGAMLRIDYPATDGSVLLLGDNAASVTRPANGINGSLAYITKANGASDPVITIVEESDTPKNYWMTYCSASDLDFTLDGNTSLVAYIATGFNTAKRSVILTRIDQVPAYTGIVIRSTDDNVSLPAGFDPTRFATQGGSTELQNLLVGVAGTIQLDPTEGDYANLILAKGDSGIGFFKVSKTGSFGPNKAYLQLPADALPQAADGLNLTFDDETTGIKDCTFDAGGHEDWYTLQGVRVARPTQSGIYLHRGVKVVVR